MHMSSACPWGRTPGQPGEYVGEYKGMNWLLCPWAAENSRHCFEFEGKGWGNSKFCKITDANHGDIRVVYRFPQPINTGNRRIFVYTFSLISICLSLSDHANKIKTLNIERA